MAPPVVSSREYKVMLDHRLFVDHKTAAAGFGSALQTVARRLKKTAYRGDFKTDTRRDIVFLDTPDQSVLLNRFVLRKRLDRGADKAEYTLKCRSPDRYVAAGAAVSSARKPPADQPKFEEDIGPPFVSRFSHSCTVNGPTAAPQTLGDAARLFPALSRLKRDGVRCPESIPLGPVGGAHVYERVLRGPELTFADVTARVALILWSDGPEGRPLVSEFSFRYGHDAEDYSSGTAQRAMRFFEEVQRLDWCTPDARTKTQFVYQA